MFCCVPVYVCRVNKLRSPKCNYVAILRTNTAHYAVSSPCALVTLDSVAGATSLCRMLIGNVENWLMRGSYMVTDVKIIDL
jgi:hypothetical protein